MLEKVAKTLILCLVVAKQVMSPHYSGVVLGLSFMNLYEYQGLKWIRQMSRQFLFPHPKHFWFLFRQENKKLKQGQYEILFVGKNDGKDRSLFWAWIKDLSEIVPVNISFRAAFLLLLGTSSWGSLPPAPRRLKCTCKQMKTSPCLPFLYQVCPPPPAEEVKEQALEQNREVEGLEWLELVERGTLSCSCGEKDWYNCPRLLCWP